MGALSAGHVEPQHLPEIIRTVKPSGLIILYLSDKRYTAQGYSSDFSALEKAGAWTLLEAEPSIYMRSIHNPGWLVIARR